MIYYIDGIHEHIAYCPSPVSPPTHISSLSFPSSPFVLYLRHAVKNKAHGEGQAPAEVWAVVADVAAQRVHPLFTKASLRLQHPLTWKGGTPT